MARTIQCPDQTAVFNMQRFFPQMVSSALLQNHAELAVDCYRLAQQMPSTGTSAAMSRSGISILDVCSKSHNTLVLYGHEGLLPVALKRMKIDSEELTRLKHFYSLEIAHESIIQFQPFEEWRFIKMPRLQSCLHELKPLDEPRQVALFNHISSALLYLHSKGIAHMDVKPENIGLNDGKFILLDCGSAARMDEFTDVTELFVPLEFKIESNGTMKASADADKWMLAMTFFVKLVSHDGRTRENKAAVGLALSGAHIWGQLNEFLLKL